MTDTNGGAASAADDVRLTDVMLAMDVVDSLRHEEALVARALNADERERVLLERVRSAYQAQGIEVSDETLAAGVRALKEREFQYEPPPPGLRTRLFRAWVNRGGIGRGVGLFGLVAATIGGGYYGFVELPAQRERSEAVQALNVAIDVADVDLQTLDQRRQSLTAALESGRSADRDTAVAAAADRLLDDAEASLESAGRYLVDASALSQAARYTDDNYGRIGDAGAAQLSNQRALLDQAKRALDATETAINGAGQLSGLPDRLRSLRDDAVALAVPSQVDNDLEALYREGIAALRQGDADTAQVRAADLQALLGELQRNYVVSVVSRPNERSGVIRAPESNLDVDNYYLIVEALDRSGRPIAVDIRSEEDGLVKRVRVWGIRVGRAVFERVRDDKADDGIIQSRQIGRKARGYLEPAYDIPVQGGLIHEW
ncbi:MAG: DUF6384 family protein [Pseudomonadota bacterium]